MGVPSAANDHRHTIGAAEDARCAPLPQPTADPDGLRHGAALQSLEDWKTERGESAAGG